MKTIPIFLLAFLCANILFAQKKVRYTEDFQFARGIYITLEDWKNNSPVKPETIIFDADPRSPKFFQYLLAKKQFRYPKDNEIIYINTDDIFGYADGKSLYYGKQYRFELIGSISLLREVDMVDTYSSFIKPGEEYEATRAEGKGKLYILDYTSGNFFRCKAGKVKSLLKRDPELYESYRKAKGGKMEKVRSFIKEYNFRHPIYFPSS